MDYTSRTNTALATLVDRCIAMPATGRHVAVAELVAGGVADRVIARVLCEPERRRPTLAKSD